MKNITVFLASSDELKNDRNSFHSLVASLDEIFEPRGYRIRCRRWEDFSAFCTGTRTQDDYNRIVRASDICICMFHRKAGEYTIEEFNQALDEYVKNQSHPKTFVYIRALIEGEMEDEALKRFVRSGGALLVQLCHRRCHEVAFCHAVGADHSIGIGQRFRNRG